MNALMRAAFWTVTAATLAANSAAQTVHYVNRSLTTGLNDGSSWANAHRGPGSLTLALANAAPSASNTAYVFVAQGTYFPSTNLDSTASFVIPGGVFVYGGFQGGEYWTVARPAPGLAPTILSGDLAQDDGGGLSFRAENSRHVVRTTSGPRASVLNGFTVRGGYAVDPVEPFGKSGGGLTCESMTEVARCEFVNNFAESAGGAIFCDAAHLDVEDCQFSSNAVSTLTGGVAALGGGAIYHREDMATIRRCSFSSNSTSGSGAAIWLGRLGSISNSIFSGNVGVPGSAIWLNERADGPARVVACTMTQNVAGFPGGYAVDGQTGSSDPVVSQSIIWGNVSLTGSLSSLNPGLLAEDSIVEGGLPGPGVLDVDPLFMDPSTDNFALQSGSPAIDVSSGAQLPLIARKADVLLRRRNIDDPMAPNGGASGGTYDLGGLERSGIISTLSLTCTAFDNSTGTPGKADAYGSPSVTTNDLRLAASDLPQNAFGFFIASQTPGFVQNPGGGGGLLCLGSPVARLVGPGQIVNSGTTGSMEVSFDLSNIPLPAGAVAAEPGEWWYFQAWHRDTDPFHGFPTSNFTDAAGIQVTL